MTLSQQWAVTLGGMRSLLSSLLDLALPQRGQLRARRNAWSGMVENHVTAVARREAERAVAESLSA